MSFEEMDPIFGRVVPEWSLPSPHTTPPPPFLYRVHRHGSDHSALRVIATDFQSNTFQVIKSRQQLEDLRDDIGIGGSWSEFVDYVTASLKSGDVKLILEGSRSSKPGGADYAKLIAQKAKGMPRVSFSISKLADGAVGEAMANVALELYKEFIAVKSLLIEEQESKYQLTKVVAAEQEKNLTLQKQLDMALYSRKHKSQKINDRETSDSTSVLVSQGSSDQVHFVPPHASPVRPERDSAQDAFQGSRFEVKRLPPAIRRNADLNIENRIFSTATLFPLSDVYFPAVSEFYPCAAVLLSYVQLMDRTMASTKRWTNHCMGWVPPYTQIYISILFYYQVIRAMNAASYLPGSSDWNQMLSYFTHYPPEALWVPGPLVQAFKNLSCFRPSGKDRFGGVTPTLPHSPGWNRKNRFSFGEPFHTHLPNISLFISRLRSVCAVATRNNMDDNLFVNDVDGPLHCASLFSQPCTNLGNEQANMISPGASLALSGDLRLWRKAAAQLDRMGMPSDLDVKVDKVKNKWSSALRLDSSTAWFRPLITMMTRYCQFFRGSAPLSDCAPNCSAAGAVKCVAEEPTDLFEAVEWSRPQNAHQVGHYVLRTHPCLFFNASTTVEDIPDEHVHAALTYCYNLAVNKDDFDGLTDGEFWSIAPDAYCRSGISVGFGVENSIILDYHMDTEDES